MSAPDDVDKLCGSRMFSVFDGNGSLQGELDIANVGRKTVPDDWSVDRKFLCPNVLVGSWYNNSTNSCRAKMTTARNVGHWHEHLSEIFRCSAMHAPVEDDTDFEIHSLFNREPIEVVSRCRCYVIERSQFGNQTGGSI